jgi:hypothetical protein
MAKRPKRSRKALEQYRRRRVADLRHMLRCCDAGRLHDADRSRRKYIEAALAADELAPPQDVRVQVRLTNAERELHQLWTIPPIDMTKEQLAERRKQKDRERKARARRKKGVPPRTVYLAPSKRTSRGMAYAAAPPSTGTGKQTKGETGFIGTTGTS